MKRKFTSIFIAMGLLTTVIWAAPSLKVNPNTPLARKVVAPVMPANLPPSPPPATDETDQVTVGTTYIDFFNIGCMARSIARDTMGGLHVTWMNTQQGSAANRTVSYNYRTPTGTWYNATGISVFNGTGAGYPCVDVLRDGRAIIAAHRPNPTTYYTTIGIDDGYQIAAFIPYSIQTGLGTEEAIWPEMAVDRSYRAHIFSSESVAAPTNDNVRIFYSRTDTGGFRPDTFRYAVTTLGFGANVATSRVSNKVAMCWGETLIPNGYTTPRGWAGFLAEQMNNELKIVQSQNGTTWNFAAPTNVTRTRIWNDTIFARTGDTVLAGGDSLRFFNDASMIYDNQDNLHVVFTTRGLWEDATVDTTQGVPPVAGLTGSACFLWHWCETRPLQYDIVADGWWFVHMQAWRSTIDRPSLSIAPNGDLYCVFTRYAPNDTSANGYPCGDIWVTASANNGQSWYYPTNITNTPANGGAAGVVHNECFAQVQETIGNDSLYVFYLDDRSGGSAWQETDLGTNWTLNQVRVHPVRTTQIRRDSVLNANDYPPLRGVIQSAPEPIANAVPNGFAILGNYPNPFNPTTEIRFSLDKTRTIRLAVYDVMGREVTVLAKGRMNAGQYKTTFDGSRLASGIYFARLVSDGVVSTQKVTLLK